MRKLIHAIGCPGDVHFYVYKRIQEGWMLEYQSTAYSYGYENDFDYKMKPISEHLSEHLQKTIVAEKMEPYNFERKPHHTSYDDSL